MSPAEPPPPPSGPDPASAIPEPKPATVASEQLSLDLALAEEQIHELSQTRELRKRFARRVFYLVAFWLALVGYVVLAQGFGVGFGDYGRFHLDNSVLIALITTSTATVIGVLAIVLNHFFPKR